MRLVARAAAAPLSAITFSPPARAASAAGVSMRGEGWAAAAGAVRRSLRIVSKNAPGAPSTSSMRNSTQSTSGKPSCLILRWNASGIRSTTNTSRGGRSSEITQLG